MGFYDLSKTERQKLVNEIEGKILEVILDLGSVTDNNDIIILKPFGIIHQTTTLT
jgi:hypothetical protein